MATKSCPFTPGDRVWGYGRDSGGIEQQESMASQRWAIERYCRQNNMVAGQHQVEPLLEIESAGIPANKSKAFRSFAGPGEVW